MTYTSLEQSKDRTTNFTWTEANCQIPIYTRKHQSIQLLVHEEVTEYIITNQEDELKIWVLVILRMDFVMEQIHQNVLIFQRRW
jgi:hypothetical protein